MDADKILARFCKRLVALDMDIFGLRKPIAEDADKWVTVHPGGKGPKLDGSGMKGGTPVLIDGQTGEVKAGMGGKFKGEKISEIRKDFVGPKTPKNKETPSPKKRLQKWHQKKIKGTNTAQYQQTGGEASKINYDKNRKELKKIFTSISGQATDFVTKSFMATDELLLGAMKQKCSSMRYMSVSDGGSRCSSEGIKINHGEKHPYSELFSSNSIYGTIRHETGHFIDRMANNISSGEDFSAAVDNTLKKISTTDNALGVKEEYLIKLGYKKNGNDYKHSKPSKNKKNGEWNGCGSISDIFSALTSDKVRDSYGHTTEYWQSHASHRNAEIFANLTDMYADEDKTMWKSMEQNFPELTSAYVTAIKKISYGWR